MKKRLSQMTTEEVKNELSVAGDPDKLILIMNDILKQNQDIVLASVL